MTKLALTFDPKVKIIADSISPEGVRLITVQFRQPRMIHSDFLTHRVFSRNGRSSRAVPVVTLLAEAQNPYVPHFLKNKPGMMATEEFLPEDFAKAEEIWRRMAAQTVQGVAELNALGVHKQWANRPLEWFGYIDVLVTSTDWNNYLALRDHEAAQPEIQMIAQAIRTAIDQSAPMRLQPGQWHLPYIEMKDWELARLFLKVGRITRDEPTGPEIIELLKKISAARCARLTYKPFDGDGSFEAELNRYKRLIEDQPVHASPIEHQATPDTKSIYQVRKETASGDFIVMSHGQDWDNPHLHGNFSGWIQQRKLTPNEYVA